MNTGDAVNKDRVVHCVIVGKPLVIPTCPIRTCCWKSTQGFCKYSRDAESLDITGLSILLGKPLPTTEQQVRIKADLLKAVKTTIMP